MTNEITVTLGIDDGKAATLVVGSPSRGGNSGSWRWGMMMMGQTYPPGCPTFVYGVEGMDTAEARNDIVQVALRKKARFLWMIDDDTAPLRCDAVRLMMSTLGQNLHKGVRAVTGIYVTKSKDCPEPLIFDEGGPMWQWKAGQIFPVKSCGAGCLLISMDVFEQIGEPWFKDDKDQGKWFVGEHGKEDIYFCEQLGKLGHTILADSRVLCAHFDKDGDMYVLPEDSYPLQTEKAQIAVVGA